LELVFSKITKSSSTCYLKEGQKSGISDRNLPCPEEFLTFFQHTFSVVSKTTFLKKTFGKTSICSKSFGIGRMVIGKANMNFGDYNLM